MSLTPAYKFTVGGQLVDTTDEPQASTLVDLLVRLDMHVASNEFKLILGNIGHFTPEREDEGLIELGYADQEGELIQVAKGKVDVVEQGSTLDHIHGYSDAAILLRAFTDQTFESKTAGDIVKDLASQAGVDTANFESGIDFPAYVIDGQKSFYQHMQDLAVLCGFDLYFNSDNQLVFQQFSGGNQVHVFNHASHIIELKVDFSAPLSAKVEAWGESGSNNGNESWAWLTKDFSGLRGNAGGIANNGVPNNSSSLRLERSALRTGEAAQKAADAALTELGRQTMRGHLLSVGRPQVKLGDTIRLSGLPEDPLNQIYQVRGVTHRITKLTGFTTQVMFRSIDSNLAGF
ncbi:hypothetical protein [Paraglaciecola sp. MB-3u-78]|uniref:hypothetical protein n=1 Tax=Paraglaciecola sp. MB-3u-78 TaxID=2058332 RepID=UPI000C326A14|nr:hypothetical protein [Paraglaciecola sp. MB-3u-78]PKH00461.1 hypothetical protein CXF95_02670 [Paraglaciecola sp. MB-3u-78]